MKFKFYIDGHFERQLKFIVGLCCLIVQHFLQYKYYQKNNHIQCVQDKLKNIANIYSNEILFPLIPMPNIKVEQIFNTQMKHSHPIINPNVPKPKINK
jgi:hypothetical protein